MCLGVPGTASLEALEVEAGSKPLVIRREELSVRQAIRIMMKLDEDHIKVSWDDSQEMVGLNIEYPFWKNECASG